MTVLGRWLLGSPLKTLGRELPGAMKDRRGYLSLVRLLAWERKELVEALMDVALHQKGATPD
jgi:hypothetical protein